MMVIKTRHDLFKEVVRLAYIWCKQKQEGEEKGEIF